MLPQEMQSRSKGLIMPTQRQMSYHRIAKFGTYVTSFITRTISQFFDTELPRDS